ncbi:uncharacterized protein LOC118241374 isoform X2 [Electrophorus electricus]|uniref:uncharacterized protein LOC118241374 isoform X1 n=1 Tax=Electrophorus electricus TaxID=8005 RepID=UPI0015D0C366|nr:uncharacterized protein LOC118241374 isoform X1 [Electrophorus electricus]XP_035382140.1 uncharacterized protein LOC118241374 isoform X1 [Electrophorus electricus]XP_035382141.1 uncharacterized protein LOC118241374 isoform X1 [Electrophorus electricus]XP_035382142.1 uncharacterized protein LOC118241374 isoform X1 [Electrophorus electricus]XP_035382143.1 uncharacterized protein LOC118241374 isoform X1 [Electrophorus electricus]XP_035382144.1 uncharacterized protein LOC118241374 isoform X2 [E
MSHGLSCCPAADVTVFLLLQLLTVIAGSFPSVKVNLHEATTLPCTQTCSGLVTWTLYHKPHDILAQCNQTSCQSEEGFHMSHDQYLKGDLSLTITDADYTKRSLYTCACKGRELCDVSLQIEACNSSIQIKPGEPLVLDLLISESVEVIYNSTDAAAPSSGQICTVAGHSLKCKPEYTRRVSLISAVELQGTTPSDSGVYSIRDTKHEEIIQTCTVTVEEVQPCPNQSSTVTVLTVLLALTGAGLVAAVLVIVQLRKKIQELQKGSTVNGTVAMTTEELI